jgi:hypothetical protein
MHVLYRLQLYTRADASRARLCNAPRARSQLPVDLVLTDVRVLSCNHYHTRTAAAQRQNAAAAVQKQHMLRGCCQQLEQLLRATMLPHCTGIVVAGILVLRRTATPDEQAPCRCCWRMWSLWP